MLVFIFRVRRCVHLPTHAACYLWSVCAAICEEDTKIKYSVAFRLEERLCLFQHIKGRPAVLVAHIPSRNEKRRKVLGLCTILILKSIFRNTKACCKDFSWYIETERRALKWVYLVDRKILGTLKM